MAAKKQAGVRWYDDAEQVKDVTAAVFAAARQNLLAQGPAGHLFPNGIDHVKIAIGANLETGFSASIEVDGPKGRTGAARASNVAQPYQLTPTASWWFKLAGNPIVKVISLGSELIETKPEPAFGWTAHREHWALEASIDDISGTLGTSDLVVSKEFQDPYEPWVPTQALIDDATDVADPDKWRFQMKAKGVLDPSPQGDWTPGAPPMGSGMLIYYREKGPVDDKSPRILFELTANKKNFARVSWLTKDRFEGYEDGFTLEQASLPTSWTGYYHYSVATGL